MQTNETVFDKPTSNAQPTDFTTTETQRTKLFSRVIKCKTWQKDLQTAHDDVVGSQSSEDLTSCIGCFTLVLFTGPYSIGICSGGSVFGSNSTWNSWLGVRAILSFEIVIWFSTVIDTDRWPLDFTFTLQHSNSMQSNLGNANLNSFFNASSCW